MSPEPSLRTRNHTTSEHPRTSRHPMRSESTINNGLAPVESTSHLGHNTRTRSSNAQSRTWYADYVGISVEFLASLPIEFTRNAVVFTFDSGARKCRKTDSRVWWWDRQNESENPALWPDVPESLSGEIWITEGETDCVVARYAGFDAYALTKGVNSCVDAGALGQLINSGVRRVVLAFDADDAGQNAIEKHTEAFHDEGLEVAICDLPPIVQEGEKDLRDIWLRDATDADTFRRMLSDAVTAFRPSRENGTHVEASEDWPEPFPICGEKPRVSPMTADMLPYQLRDWCFDVAERMSVPIDFTGVAAMVILSAAIGRRAMIYPKVYDNWCVVPNLWGAIIGQPGVRKSPALLEMLKALKQIESASFDKHKSALSTFEWKQQRYEARKRAIEKELEQPDVNETTLRAELESLRPEPPVLERFVVNDSTTEKLLETLGDNPNGLLVYRDELAGFLVNMDKKGREGDRQFYLEAWSGDSTYTTDRIGRGTIRVEHVCVSILGTIQPGPLRNYVREAFSGSAHSDGLIQRFQLLVWPDMPTAYRHVDRKPDEKAREFAYRLYEECVSMNDATREFHFSSRAQRIFNEWLIDWENRILSGREDEVFVAHISKFRSLVPSIALLFHLAGPNAREDEVDAVESAIRWAEYLETHAARVYDIAEPAPIAAVSLAQKIIDRQIDDGFSEADVRRKNWSGLTTANSVADAIAILVDSNWIRDYIPERVGPGRTTVRYRVNPKVYTE